MQTFSRSDWLKLVGASAAGATTLGVIGQGPMGAEAAAGSAVAYALPALPYKPDALEPHIDARTIGIHHGKHHAGYVRGLNATLEKLDAARKSGDYAAIQALARALAFHGSGHVLHTLYFSNLAPKSRPPRGALLAAINANFGSLDALQAQLSAATAKVAGSGWGMLAYEPLGKRLVVLQIEKHENQMLCGAVPLLLIDVWEHAYYLNYQNRRGDYIKAIMNVINWGEVARRYDRAQ